MTIAPARFEHNESYKHKYAKKVLADWLREDLKNGSDYSEIGNIRFRSNRGAPYYGIHEEYPISEAIINGGYVDPWDETDGASDKILATAIARQRSMTWRKWGKSLSVYSISLLSIKV